ncbi:MAG: hypothetical protein RLZZ543_2146 [Bacteroidota bacterium]|jgi:PAS domain S-box-containing protein
MNFWNPNIKGLVIEDNQGDYLIIRDYFESELPNTKLVNATTLRDAKALFNAETGWDFVLLDLTLPDASGFQLLNEVFLLIDKLPLIVLTAYTNKEFGVQALSLGVLDYLLKDELTASVLAKSVRYSFERKKINDDLRISELKYKNMFYYSPIPLWVFDIETYKFLDVNQSAVRQYGYSREEFLSMTIKDVRPISEVEKLIDVVRQSQSEGLYYNGTFTHIKKNGEQIRVEIQSNAIEFDGRKARLVQANDITERLLTEHALVQSEKRFRALVQEGAEMISVMDKEYNFQFNSPSCATVLRYENGYLIGRNPLDFVHPDDIDKVRSGFELLSSQKRVQLEAFRFKDFVGEWHWLETILTNLLDEPSIHGIISNTRDVTQRYIYEETIRKQSALFKAMVEKSPDMKTLVSADGVILFTTPSVTKVLGYETNELIGKYEQEIVHPEDINLMMDVIASTQLEAQLSKMIEIRIKHKNGHYVWCEKVITNQLQDSDLKAIVCNFWDITEIKNAQLKIQESNDRYNKVAKATSDAIWDLDIKAGQLLWNLGLKNLFGYETVDNTTSLSFWEERIHPDDRLRVITNFNLFLTKGIENWQDEYRFLCSNGQYKFVFDRGFLVMDEKCNALRMIGAMQDITRQKEEENRLRIMESVITHTSDSVVITEDVIPGQDGPLIIYVNDAFIQMTGYSSDEIIGKTPCILQSVNSNRAALDEIRTAMMDLRSCEVELINRKKNGADYWVNISIAPVIDDKGKVTHWIAIQRDITERKKLEQDREMMIQELTSNNKDLKQFSYITSHNLRAPLSNLIGILNLFQDIEIKDKQVAALVKGFKVSTEQLNTTINDLIRILIIKDNPSLEQEVLEFTSVLDKVMSQFHSLLTISKVEIQKNFNHATKVRFSRAYLESILQNLISNSIKYQSEERPLSIHISTEEEHEWIVMRFSDNGSGFDLPRLRDRLFGLYQRFHNHPDSKGLGLYLVKSQMEALGGRIEVESAVNKGTKFTLYFRK